MKRKRGIVTRGQPKRRSEELTDGPVRSKRPQSRIAESSRAGEEHDHVVLVVVVPDAGDPRRIRRIRISKGREHDRKGYQGEDERDVEQTHARGIALWDAQESAAARDSNICLP